MLRNLYYYYNDFFFSSRRRHTRWPRDWSSDVCSSDLAGEHIAPGRVGAEPVVAAGGLQGGAGRGGGAEGGEELGDQRPGEGEQQHQGRQDHGGACGDPAPGPGRRAQGEGPGLGRRLGLGRWLGRWLGLGLGLGLGLRRLSLGMGAHRAVTVALRVGAVAPVRRSLASRTGYMRSTIRLISTNTTVDSTTTAIRTGVSRAATAWAVSCPLRSEEHTSE